MKPLNGFDREIGGILCSLVGEANGNEQQTRKIIKHMCRCERFGEVPRGGDGRQHKTGVV